MEVNEPDHDVAVRQVGALVDRHRWDQATALLSQAIATYPDSVPLRNYRALVLWVTDHDDDAVATIESILSDEPDDYDARSLLARIRMHQGKYSDAEQILISLLKDYPDQSHQYATYAELMLHTMNFEKAERLASEALSRDPGNEQAMNAHVLSGFVNSSGNEQRDRLQRLLREHPDQTRTVVQLVQHLLDNGRHKDAHELSRELVQADPANERLVDMASELRHANHWSMKPLWPMQRFGWAGSIAIWFGAVLLFRSGALDGVPELRNVLLIALLLYVLYSWVWPSLLKRILR